MSHLISFTLGYFIGGACALFLVGLTLAARRGDQANHPRASQSEDSVSAWRERS